MKVTKNAFEENFSLHNLKNIPLSYFRKHITPYTQEFIRPDGTAHTMQLLQTKNQRMKEILEHLFYKKVTLNNEDWYISKFSIKNFISRSNVATADNIQQYFDTTTPSVQSPQEQEAQRVVKTVKRHFIQMAIDTTSLKKDQFLQKEYGKTTFTLLKTDTTSYNILTQGKEIGRGSLKRAYILVSTITSQLSQVDYSTKYSKYNHEIRREQEELEFKNYTLLCKEMRSHTNLLLFQKKYRSPTGRSKIIAEKCDGNLSQIKSRLTEIEKVALAIQEAKVLASVHAAGYVHLDVKPENFLVKTNPETQEKEIRLCDFEYLLPSHQKAWRRGTPLFMAHELLSTDISESTEITPAMDVFSYGATLYNLFPLPNDTKNLITWRPVRNQEHDSSNILQKQKELRASIDPIHSLIADCIDCDPKTRPSMEEVVKRLETITPDPTTEVQKKEMKNQSPTHETNLL